MGNLFVHAVGGVFPYFPFIYGITAALVLFFVLLRGFWNAAAALPMRATASGLEEKFPGLRDDVTNALLLYRQSGGRRPTSGSGRTSDPGRTSDELVAAHLEKTADTVAKIHPNQLVGFKRTLRAVVRPFLFILASFTVIFLIYPRFPGRSLALLLDPLSSLPPRETIISIEPVPSPVLRGTPVSIRAKAAGFVPDSLALRLWPEGGGPISRDMAPEGNGQFVHRIDSIRSSIRYQAFGHRAETPEYGLAVVDAPEIARMKLTLIPPGYSRLPREVREGGYIEALKGTVVNLEARATKPVREGRLVLNRNDTISLKVAGNTLRATLFVLTPGTYSLAVEDEHGFGNPDPVEYGIRLIPDGSPECEISIPAEELEVLGNELLPIPYTARDDFGVTSVTLLYQTTRAQGTIALKQLINSRSVGPEIYHWDLEDLALAPGDRASFRIEAWDNDTISGPKAGYSRTFTLKVKDEKESAAGEAERAREIADALLDLLADQLERVKDRRELSEDLSGIMERVDEQFERMGAERFERFDLEALKRNLESLNRRIHDLPEETTTREIERLNLLAENLAERARMNEAEALSREIRNRQRQLIDEIQNLEGPLAGDALQDLLKELETLKELLSRIMEALSDAARTLPDELTGRPDLAGFDFQELFKDLEEIGNRLAAGDPKGALEIAREMLDVLSDMLAAMAATGAGSDADSLGRLGSEMNRQAGELEKILGEQKEILKGTESVDRELTRRGGEQAKENFDRTVSRLEELLKQLEQALGPSESGSGAEMGSYLKGRQIEKLTEAARRLKERVGGRADAAEPGVEEPEIGGPSVEEPQVGGPSVLELLDELLSALEGLVPRKSDVMTQGEREKFPGLSSRQERLEGRTRDLIEKLDMLSQLFPGMDVSILDDLRGAAESMDSAEGNLRMEDAPGAIPPEEEAIRSLSRSLQGMQQGAQRMGREMRMQADRRGSPWGYDRRPGWYSGPGIPLPTLPQPEVRKQREKGRTGIDTEEFEPPSKDAYRTPPNLREKIMEALKEQIPPQYRRDVERYFRGLTE